MSTTEYEWLAEHGTSAAIGFAVFALSWFFLGRNEKSEMSIKDYNSQCSQWADDAKGLDAIADGCNSWEFVTENIDKKFSIPLAAVAYAQFSRLGFLEKYKINKKKFFNFFGNVYDGYRDNPYHNKLHATDILHKTYFLITNPEIYSKDYPKEGYLGDLEVIATLISAAAHDYDHQGCSNKFLAATNSDLSVLYNGRSPLEAHSAASAIRLLLTPGTDFLDGLSRTDFQYIRKLVVEMIMMTDMAYHKNIVDQTVDLAKRSRKGEGLRASKMTEADRTLILSATLHVADISNSAKQEEQCDLWVDRLMDEFWKQGDKERKLGIEVTKMPNCDKATTNVAKDQIGFMKYCLMPMYEAYEACFPKAVATPMKHLKNNCTVWAERSKTSKAAGDAASS